MTGERLSAAMKSVAKQRRAGSRRPVRYLTLLLALAVAGTGLGLVFGFLGQLHPALDFFSHFRIHLSVLLALLSLALLTRRGWRLLGLGALTLSVTAVATTLNPAGALHPLTTRPDTATAGTANAHYRLLQLNLRYDNATPARVLALIARMRPDVITLEEVSEHWKPWLAQTKGMYPYRIICPPPSPIGGVAILSRRPFVRSRPARCHDRGSMAVARVLFGGHGVDIAALHLGWPWPFDQPHQVEHISGVLSDLEAPTILAGDFNAVPWSASVMHVAQAGHLRVLRGIGPTWLARALPHILRRRVGLPIDNVLIKGGVVAESVWTLPTVGSDHLPVLFGFGLRKEARPSMVLQAKAEQ